MRRQACKLALLRAYQEKVEWCNKCYDLLAMCGILNYKGLKVDTLLNSRQGVAGVCKFCLSPSTEIRWSRITATTDMPITLPSLPRRLGVFSRLIYHVTGLIV